MFVKFQLITLPLFASVVLVGSAQDENGTSRVTQTAGGPERIDLSHFPGQMVDKVVVPIPAEIFSVLDKVGEPNWAGGIQMPGDDEKIRDRDILALRFGGLVAEGFIAVQAKSSDDIQKIGRRVLSLAESLGLADAVRPHSQSIIESAGKRDWGKVREELDGTQQTVRSTMEKLRDDELSGLVSLGGWLRGTNVLTEFISEFFSEDKAELLNQPGLVSHFRKMMTELKEPVRDSPRMKSLATGLARLEAVLNQSPTISEESVNQLNLITRDMLEEFYFKKGQEESARAGEDGAKAPARETEN